MFFELRDLHYTPFGVASKLNGFKDEIMLCLLFAIAILSKWLAQKIHFLKIKGSIIVTQKLLRKVDRVEKCMEKTLIDCEAVILLPVLYSLLLTFYSILTHTN